MIEILLPSWLGGIFLAIASGPLGSFVVWCRMSYFGDTLAHTCLLGIAFGLMLNINPYYTIIMFTILLSLILVWLEIRLDMSMDTLLGIMAHSSLSLGLVILSVTEGLRVNMMSYLFGDLLAITPSDLWILGISAILVIIVLTWKWHSLILMTINADLAEIEGINIKHTRLILIMMTALTIGIAIKFVGTLIITSLLIIPAATACNFSLSPQYSALISIIVGIISVTGGLIFSAFYDTPVGPSIVVFSTVLFIISVIKKSVAD